MKIKATVWYNSQDVGNCVSLDSALNAYGNVCLNFICLSFLVMVLSSSKTNCFLLKARKLLKKSIKKSSWQGERRWVEKM